MSYILNALKKSEKQRQAGRAESLESRILEQPLDEQKKTPYWLIMLVIVNICFLSYFIWSYLKEDESSEHQIKTYLKATPDQVTIDKPIHRSIVKPTEKQQQKSISEHIEKQQESITQLVKKQEAHKPKPTTEKKPLNKSLKKQPPKLGTKNIVLPEIESIAIIEKPAIKEIKESVAVKEKTADIPFLSELAYDFRRTVPSIDINVFVYSENKAERFIMVDMKKYQSGQQIKNGLKLKEIRMNSLIVEYKNRVFQIKRK
jgi:general secretion pathway protein B